MLQSRQIEVASFLRLPLSSDGELEEAYSRVQAALQFDDRLTDLAESRQTTKGTLFQALLETLRQSGVESSQLDNDPSEVPQPAPAERFDLGEAEWAELVRQAEKARGLVRVKLADDNDLKTARTGLLECEEFFSGVRRVATLRGDSISALYSELDS